LTGSVFHLSGRLQQQDGELIDKLTSQCSPYNKASSEKEGFGTQTPSDKPCCSSAML